MDPVTFTASVTLGLVGLGIGAFFRFGPGKTLGALADAILGEPAVYDRGGHEIEAEKKGLVARTKTLEDAVALLVDQDARIVQLERHDAAKEALLAEHSAAIAALIATTFEKGAESTLKAEEMKQANVVDGEVEE